MVRPDGFEPPTPCSEDKCSNPLSYGRVITYFTPDKTILPEYNSQAMTKITNFQEANAALTGFVLPDKETDYTLKRTIELMDYLHNPQNKLRVIHVAGTSGKTSTCYYIAAMLNESGYKVGLTVSPHVDEINERVQVNMVPLVESEYCKQLTNFLGIVEKSGIKPSYFEILIAFGYWQFAKQKVDYAVIEVGMGGLLDGTNVVSRPDKICVITDIGLDHTNILGKDLKSIAMQKAGIILPSNHVFIHPQDRQIMEVVRLACKENNAKLQIVPDAGSPPSLPLFQQRNWSLARAVAEHIAGPLKPAVVDASTKTIVPARMEIIERQGKTIVFDGSHNQQKLQALEQSLKKKFPNQPIAALISFGQNKESIVINSLDAITDVTTHIIFTKFRIGQDEYRTAINPKTLENLCKARGFRDTNVETDPVLAFKQLLKRPEQVLLVTGSFYLLNHVRPLILK